MAPTDENTIDEDLAGYSTPNEWSTAKTDGITWDDVRRVFVGITASLSETVTAQRQER